MEEYRRSLSEYISVLKTSLANSPWAEDRILYINHLVEAAFMFAAIEEGKPIEKLKNIVISERHSYDRDYLHGTTGNSAKSAFYSFGDLVEKCDPNDLEYRTIIDSESNILQLKGFGDDYPPPYDLFWLRIRVKHHFDICAETQIFVARDTIVTFINELGKLHEENSGNSNIKDLSGNSYISFEFDKSGELLVTGSLNMRWDEDNTYLRFKFASDKTAIPNLVQVLKDIIAN
jgi:hypothetical protein